MRATSGAGPLDLLGLDLVLPQQDQDLQALVRQVVDEQVRPHVRGWFEQGGVPRSLARSLGEVGLLGMHLEGYGCSGTSALAYGLACLELEAADSGVRSLVSVQGSLAMFSIHRFGSREQKERWLPRMASGEAVGCFGLTEPDAGSNPAGMSTRARRDGDGWVLRGTKTWITNAPFADVATIWARTDDGIRGFLVELGGEAAHADPSARPEGVAVTEIGHKLSLRASVTGEIVLDDVRVGQEAMLPEAQGLRAPLTCLDEARFGIAFGALGAARDSLETAIAYAGTREVFDRSLSSYQLTQGKLADMTVALAQAFTLALHLAALKDAGVIRPEQVSLGKLASTRAALEIARECRTILGASGITTEYSPMRHACNLETVLTYEGTEEIHQLTIGRALTGEQAFR